MALNVQYVCKNCNKEYKRHGFYAKHIVQCQPVKFTLNKPVNIDSIKTPSQCQQTLEYLLSHVDELQHKMREMENERRIEKKKVDILSWLNEKYNPETNYSDYISSLDLDIKYLESLQENNLLTVIDEIFNNCFKKTDNNICLKAFTVKVNKIYVYTENNWKELSNSDLKDLMSKILKIFRELLQNWYEKNTALIKDNLSDKYLKLVKQVNNININNPNFINKIYKQLYDILKVPIKIIEYELI